MIFTNTNHNQLQIPLIKNIHLPKIIINNKNLLMLSMITGVMIWEDQYLFSQMNAEKNYMKTIDQQCLVQTVNIKTTQNLTTNIIQQFPLLSHNISVVQERKEYQHILPRLSTTNKLETYTMNTHQLALLQATLRNDLKLVNTNMSKLSLQKQFLINIVYQYQNMNRILTFRQYLINAIRNHTLKNNQKQLIITMPINVVKIIKTKTSMNLKTMNKNKKKMPQQLLFHQFLTSLLKTIKNIHILLNLFAIQVSYNQLFLRKYLLKMLLKMLAKF